MHPVTNFLQNLCTIMHLPHHCTAVAQQYQNTILMWFSIGLSILDIIINNEILHKKLEVKLGDKITIDLPHSEQ